MMSSAPLGTSRSPLSPLLPLREGDLLGGRYRVESLLDARPARVLFAATDLKTGARVTAHVLAAPTEGDPARAAFLAGARNAKGLTSPHTARVLDVGVTNNGYPWSIREHLGSDTLEAHLRKQGAISTAEAIDVTLAICDSIAEVHAHDLLHLALGPRSVHVAWSATGLADVKVTDAGTTSAETNLALGPTRDLECVLRSPEQLRNGTKVDERADVWAIAVLLHTMVAGATPFAADTPSDASLSVVIDDAPSLAGVPDELADIVERALAKDPEQRPSTVLDLAESLVPFASRPDAARERVAKRRVRSKRSEEVLETVIAMESDPTLVVSEEEYTALAREAPAPLALTTPKQPKPTLTKPPVPKPPVPKSAAPATPSTPPPPAVASPPPPAVASPPPPAVASPPPPPVTSKPPVPTAVSKPPPPSSASPTARAAVSKPPPPPPAAQASKAATKPPPAEEAPTRVLQLTEPAEAATRVFVAEPAEAATKVLHVTEPAEAATKVLHVTEPAEAATKVLHVTEPAEAATKVLRVTEPAEAATKVLRVTEGAAPSETAHVTETARAKEPATPPPPPTAKGTLAKPSPSTDSTTPAGNANGLKTLAMGSVNTIPASKPPPPPSTKSIAPADKPKELAAKVPVADPTGPALPAATPSAPAAKAAEPEPTQPLDFEDLIVDPAPSVRSLVPSEPIKPLLPTIVKNSTTETTSKVAVRRESRFPRRAFQAIGLMTAAACLTLLALVGTEGAHLSKSAPPPVAKESPVATTTIAAAATAAPGPVTPAEPPSPVMRPGDLPTAPVAAPPPPHAPAHAAPPPVVEPAPAPPPAPSHETPRAAAPAPAAPKKSASPASTSASQPSPSGNSDDLRRFLDDRR